MEGPFTDLKKLNPYVVVTCIMGLMDKRLKDDVIIAQLKSEFLVDNDDAIIALELTRTGLFRATTEFKGTNISFNDLGPITNMAKQLGLEQLKQEKKAASGKKRWWKFWKKGS